MNLMDIVDSVSRLDVMSLKDVLGENQSFSLEVGLVKKNKNIVHVDFEIRSVIFNSQQAILMIGINTLKQVYGLPA